MLRIALVSDTHGLLRPELLAFLAGSDHIIHAGDLCAPEVLAPLQRIAPLTVVRGNNDRGAWAQALPETDTVSLGGVPVFVVHDAAWLRRQPAPAGTRVVVTGHSHQPLVRECDGVLHINPGSAGPRRFQLPIAAGELRIGPDRSVQARIVPLVGLAA